MYIHKYQYIGLNRLLGDYVTVHMETLHQVTQNSQCLHICTQLFTTIYGCGTATADRWYKLGLRTITDIRQSREINLTDTQRLGLQYYDHLSKPVSREETEVIRDYVLSQAEVCCPGTTVEAVGGYRRYGILSVCGTGMYGGQKDHYIQLQPLPCRV